ncbi:Twik (KCNK-like) family of potassium channelsalpha subunit 21 [Aphelenchoides avenae]|nr:Twik (KCNK-like) family of potassium channelsalpha subunit 21 [Aphelenchus avenae]
MESGQNKDALKVLERYVRKKYRVSTLTPTSNVPSSGFDGATSTPEPFSPSTSSSFFQFNLPSRLSKAFSKNDSEKGMSEEFTTEPAKEAPITLIPEFLESQQTIKEEIKQRPTETKASYVWRVLKFLYNRLGLKHGMLLFLLMVYSLLGGLLFFYLEAPAEKDRAEKLIKSFQDRHLRYYEMIKFAFKKEHCLYEPSLPSEANETHVHEQLGNGGCAEVIHRLLQSYDREVGLEPKDGKEIWKWDFWNSVFFALSLSTTIGYGNLACRTFEGRVATIMYALVGIPLMLAVLNSMGKVLFVSVRSVWEMARAKIKKRAKRIRKRLHIEHIHITKTCDGSQSLMPQTTEEIVEVESDIDTDAFETFPLYLAVMIVFTYIAACSVIINLWEDWDWFTAFYYLFISMSTIGLGDEMPEHPHFAVCFYIFFIVGLAMVSMCVSLLQIRMENKYMAALQMIDEEHRAMVEGVVDDDMTIAPTTAPGCSNQRYEWHRGVPRLGAHAFERARQRGC